MKQTAIIIALGAAIGFAALPSAAIAQNASQGQYFDPSREAPPLTVRKRGFTDSGTSVPIGYENRYVSDQTTLRRPVYSSFAPDRFGQQVLPRPFDGLGLN